VLEQSVADLEVLVVDDGSTDGTLDHLPADPRVRALPLTHTGSPAQVRNAGLRAARGTFVAFLDSDDTWLPPKLERQLAALDGQPEAWSYTNYDLLDQGGAVVAMSGGPWRPFGGWIVEALLSSRASATIVSLLVPRALALDIGFDHRLHLYEDFDFVVRLAIRAPAVPILDVLVHVREHPGRRTRAERTSHAWRALSFARVPQYGVTPTARRLARRLAVHHLRLSLPRGLGQRPWWQSLWAMMGRRG